MTHYLLGIDVGSSSIKVAIVDRESNRCVARAQSPSSSEFPITSPQPGFAEQDPTLWWEHAQNAIRDVLKSGKIEGDSIGAIGIAYQMHGLVLLDGKNFVLRPSIIWCDSRAIPVGKTAAEKLGEGWCRDSLLNLPGNFTASKLRWVIEHEPSIARAAKHFCLPGDYIGLCLTGRVATTASGLSEGIMWNFARDEVAKEVLQVMEIDEDLIPEVVPTFGVQGELTKEAARGLGLRAGIPISYRAGDQPNNALSLGVVSPGDVAANAGTSGVVYAVGDKAIAESSSRVNTFLHVNHRKEAPRYGSLLCINGTGIAYSWIRKITGRSNEPYSRLNDLSEEAGVGAMGLLFYPYGNGAERTLGNSNIGGSFSGVDFNVHSQAELYRAVIEGVACSMEYGLSILREMGITPALARVGNANLFLSQGFRNAFTNITKIPVVLLDVDGAEGAARGAGLGAGLYADERELAAGITTIGRTEPNKTLVSQYEQVYERWRNGLRLQLSARTQ